MEKLIVQYGTECQLSICCIVLHVPDVHRSADSNQQSLTNDKALHRIIKRTHDKQRSKALLIVKYVDFVHEVLTPDTSSV